MIAEFLPQLVGFLTALLLLFWLRQSWQIRRLRRDVEELRKQLGKSSAEGAPVPVSFSTNLNEAEKEQLQAAQPAMPRNAAEKYRYVASLGEQGLEASAIASALQMSPAEVEQLLQLSKLKKTSPKVGN